MVTSTYADGNTHCPATAHPSSSIVVQVRNGSVEPLPHYVHHYVVPHFIMTSRHIAEQVAHDAYMNYHRARLQLDIGLDQVDQLRKYIVEEREDNYIITYRNGFDAGRPSTHAFVNKETGGVTYV